MLGEEDEMDLVNAKTLLQKENLNGMIKKICSDSKRTHEDKL